MHFSLKIYVPYVLMEELNIVDLPAKFLYLQMYIAQL